MFSVLKQARMLSLCLGTIQSSCIREPAAAGQITKALLTSPLTPLTQTPEIAIAALFQVYHQFNACRDYIDRHSANNLQLQLARQGSRSHRSDMHRLSRCRTRLHMGGDEYA